MHTLTILGLVLSSFILADVSGLSYPTWQVKVLNSNGVGFHIQTYDFNPCQHECPKVKQCVVFIKCHGVKCKAVPLCPPPRCFLPKAVGPCKKRFLRYFFNAHTGKCERFFFSGCGGNANNFNDLIWCNKFCKPHIKPLGVCHQPKVAGFCKAHFLRWWYNKHTNACERFVYGGCGGNANNFKTLETCSWRCDRRVVNRCFLPRVIGSCHRKGFRWYYNPATRKCVKYIGCPHLGNNFPNLHICQKECVVPRVVVCHQRKVVGPCRGKFLRFWYNKLTNQCEKFFYGGCKGNSNNFVSPAACRRRCVKRIVDRCFLPRIIGVCRHKVWRYYYNSQTSTCQFYKGCPANSGNNFPHFPACSKECVVPRVHICHQPIALGTCNKNLLRFWYNKQTNRCVPFIFKGCHGNANNFNDLPTCRRVCVKPVLSVCHQPKVVGPCKAKILRYWFNIATNRCEQFFYGGCKGNANNFHTPALCNARCVKQPVNRCFLPLIFGACPKRVVRYYYNRGAKRCLKYFGCPGVGNSFASEIECDNHCIEPVIRRCNLPRVTGSCLHKITRYYYNKHTKKCETYKGCPGIPGIGNNFPSLFACSRVCFIRNLGVCRQPKEVGPCRGFFIRWWYNRHTNACERFIYGGCKGNVNNFKTLEACSWRCDRRVVNKCFLPKIIGACPKKFTRYFYNAATRKCESYVGCPRFGNSFPNFLTCAKECGKPRFAVCSQPKVVGPCKKRLPRYWYNRLTNKCERFTYGGCKGNDNNFISQFACSRKCVKRVVDRCFLPRVVGVCNKHLHRLRYYFNSYTRSCLPYKGCPATYGNNFPSLAGCSRHCVVPRVTICQQPKALGTCNAHFVRFWYNKQTNRCVPFTFKGCHGNANNFKNLLNCRRVCVKPLLSNCHQPKVVGPCKAKILRYWFNRLTNRCEQFFYGGCKGNGNNFHSLQVCSSRCVRLPVNKCLLPKIIFQTCPKKVTRYFYNRLTKRCQRFIGCPEIGGNNYPSLVACTQECVIPAIKRCNLPRVTGSCLRKIPRYYYNKHTRKCERYIGCPGTPGVGNNFRFIFTCSRLCVRPMSFRCHLPRIIGTCKHKKFRYFYNIFTKKCERYFGCSGVGNNFVDLHWCNKFCQPTRG